MAREPDRRTCAEWRSRLARHAKSGLTVARFCDREDVAVATSHDWRPKCRDEATVAEEAPAEIAAVEVVNEGSVTIRFPGGPVMEIPDPRENLLRSVIGVLAGGSEPC